MSGVTDIPDWCWVEALGSGAYFEAGGERSVPAPPDVLGRMLACSPASRVDAVKAPTLLALGAQDKRVPPSQGVEWH